MYTFYKYTELKYALNLVNKGEILLRPLQEFHKIENFGKVIGDKNEGKVKFFANEKVFDTSDPNHNKSVAQLISNTFQAGRVVLNFQELNFHTNNCFIYSTSRLATKDLAKEMGYDACVEIFPYENFYRTLTDHMIKLGLKVKDTSTVECFYLDKTFDLDQELPDALCFLKDKHYAIQKEVRSAWIIEDVPQEPLLITCPEIRKFCSVIDLK